MSTQGSFTIPGWPSTCVVAIPTAGMDGKRLGVDSDWAAFLVIRKSSSATYLMQVQHPIFAASSTQTILSLSSGEAEFYGAVRCACRKLGSKSLMSDLSLEVKAELVTDSSACKGLWENSTHPLSKRRGTTTDWDYSACGKRLGSRCRNQGGHPRRHHVVTAGHVSTGQGRRSSEASVVHGRSASGGVSFARL